MAKSNMEIVGMEKLSRQLRKNMDLEPVKKEVKRYGGLLQRDAMRNAAVDTGTLKRSISIDIEDEGLTAKIQPNVEYAPYIEYGTRYMSAQPFMKPSFLTQSIAFKQALDKLVK